MKFESYAANAIFNAFGQNRPNTLTNYLTVKLSNQPSKISTVGGLRIILLLLSSKKIVGELDTK
jgi:hypothetical protein